MGREAWPPCADHEETAAAIRWLFHRQTGPRSAVINADDAGARPILEALREAGEQIVVPISGRARTPGGVYVAGGRLVDDIEGNAVPVMELPALDGRDALFAAAAYAAALGLGAAPPAAMASLQSFFLD